MIYAISDMHGCYEKYQELLKTIEFGTNDTLYVLGDVIDRGHNSFELLLDMASRPNVVGLMGNHEAMAISALSDLLSSGTLYEEADTDEMRLWFHNGGRQSLRDFLHLSIEQRQTAWHYLVNMPLYKEVEIGNRKFVLVHGGLENFSPTRSLDDYTPDEILWSRPKPDTVYYPDKLLICGHTPTQILYMQIGENTSPARFFQEETFIDIDCGCTFPDGRLGCLCLNTMEEIYI